MKIITFFLIYLFIIFVFVSCDPDDTSENNNISFNKNEGIFILNEGLFNQANASVFYYNFDKDSIYEDIFQSKNNEKTGDVLQSMFIIDNTGYLVINNSGLIRKVNLQDFKQLQLVAGLVSPRQFFRVDNTKAYISDIFSNKIKIYSLPDDKITGEILTGRWTENFASNNEKVYVTCPWIFSKPISKIVYEIDPESDKITDSLITGINPTNISIDKNGYLWTLCAGNSIEGIKGSLFKTDLKTKKNVDSVHFDQVLNIFNTGMNMNSKKDSLFVLYNDVMMISTTGKIKTEPVIKRQKENFYGFNIDNQRNLVYLTDALNFASRGKVLIYTKKGLLIKTINAGLIPNNVISY
ncbi:MAG: YncE family protein [Deltaproteobacteria bacterium]